VRKLLGSLREKLRGLQLKFLRYLGTVVAVLVVLLVLSIPLVTGWLIYSLLAPETFWERLAAVSVSTILAVGLFFMVMAVPSEVIEARS